MKIKDSRKIQLQQQGWSDLEIKHAEAVLGRSEKQDVFFSRIVFWSALLVIIIGNVLVSLFLIPFLVVFSATILYAVVILLGAAIGFLYNFLMTDVEHLEQKHHLLAAIIIPLIALLNIFVIVGISNQFIANSNINNTPHNPIITGLLFVVALLLPYAVDRIRLHFQDNKNLG